jgi:glucose/arabinose dehydrogenase
MRKLILISLAAGALLAAAPASAQTVQLAPYGGQSYERPYYVTGPPGDPSRVFVVEGEGRILLVKDGVTQGAPFLDIRGEVFGPGDGCGGECGMFSMAPAPDYAASGLFYVAYTDHRNALRVVEFRRSTGNELRADRSSARLVLRIPEPTTKHHGGLVVFGPDGHLYIGSGDGGPSGDPDNAAQSKRVLLGKILRIDPRPGRRPKARSARGGKRAKRAAYTIPADNPLVGRPGRDEIFAYGLRNPWRFSFDRPSRTIAVADVGNDRYEEIDYLPADKARGANFGWSFYEANTPFKAGLPKSRTVLPVKAYPHGPGCAVTGGYVVRDPRLARIKGRELVGRYLFGDYCSGKLFAFRVRTDGRVGKERSFRFRLPYLSSFGRDNAGRIYLLVQQGLSRKGKPTLGAVYRLDPRRKELG